MLGKKSKFEEHERKSELQDQEDSNGKNVKADRSKGVRKSKADKQQSLSSTDNVGSSKLLRVADLGTSEEAEIRMLSGDQPTRDELKKEAIEAEEEKKEYLAESELSRPDGPDEQDPSEDTTPTGTSLKLPGTHPTILKKTNIKSDSDMLWDEIQNGVKGKNSGIPMGFNRLNKYLGLRKSIYTTIGAAAGCGKTSLVDCAYVLNPYDWYSKNQKKSNVKFEVIYFSMERKKTYKLAKWLCLKIWMEEKILITTDELLSWQTTLEGKKQEMAKFYIDTFIKPMMDSGIVKILDGQMNPTGVYKYMKAHALKNGVEEELSEYEHRYIPNNDNLITNVIHDHAGKTKNENIGGKYDKKLSIDKVSEYYCWARDYLGYSPIMINQFNRTSYQDIQFSKKEGGDPDPTVEYWKDSGNVIEDCDVAISLFNPYKYSLEEYMGYTVNDFTDDRGNNKFRGLKIIKNSYGTDNLRIGLGFLGEVGLFKELTKAQDITQLEVNKVINNNLFLG